MFFDIGRSASIRKKIEAIDLAPFVTKAQELFGLDEEDAEAAKREYRHFLYLVYWNKRLAGDTMVVPTKRADMLWHAHILYTRYYEAACQDIFGTFLHHNPGLEEGTPPFEHAMKHTKRLHNHVYRDRGKPGFDEDYFSFVDVSEPPRRRSSSNDSGGGDSPISFDGGPVVSIPSHEHGSNFGGGSSGGGGASGTWSSDSPSSSDSGGSDGGGAGGGGCGGGGCGG